MDWWMWVVVVLVVLAVLAVAAIWVRVSRRRGRVLAARRPRRARSGGRRR